MRHHVLYFAVLSLCLCALPGCASSIKPPRDARGVDVPMMTTGYCKCGVCCGWTHTWYGKPVIKGTRDRKQVGVTASGTKARPGTIAADTTRYPFGTIMYIPGYGYGRVEDRGSAIKGDHIDLFFKRHRQALRWGRQQHTVRVWK